jgi:hypothetical protein
MQVIESCADEPAPSLAPPEDYEHILEDPGKARWEA